METQTKCGIPEIYWTWAFFSRTTFPPPWDPKNPFPWNGLGQIFGGGFASQQGRVERQLQVTHRNLGFGYPGAYDASKHTQKHHKQQHIQQFWSKDLQLVS